MEQLFCCLQLAFQLLRPPFQNKKLVRLQTSVDAAHEGLQGIAVIGGASCARRLCRPGRALPRLPFLLQALARLAQVLGQQIPLRRQRGRVQRLALVLVRTRPALFVIPACPVVHHTLVIVAQT